MYFIGIDLGTSAVKLLLMDEAGNIKNTVSREYPLEFPQPGWSQQAPEDWRDAVLEAIPRLLAGFDASQVMGIGCGGQMHGLVILDSQDRVIRPAILWNDGRTEKQVRYLNEDIGRERLSRLTGNIAFAGFTAPKLLWLKEKEPDNFSRIAKIMLPKDYINYVLTGVHACDYSDASGTLLLDVEHKRWSDEMLEICSVRKEQMPRLYESYQPIGNLRPDIARALGLSQQVLVCAGAGDNAAAAIGTGVIGDGGCNISIGTSGTVLFPPRALHLTGITLFTPSPMPTEHTTLWAACSLRPPATSGSWRIYTLLLIMPLSRQPFPAAGLGKTMCSSSPISWGSAVP